MLLLEDAQLEDRRAAARGPLAPLFESLSAELEPLLQTPLYIPEAKALLSRIGGRCERDGVTLEFDPWSPNAHRCPQCGRVHTGELHHRAWVTSYQLWLAERAVHAALFFLLRGEERYRALVRDILREYSDRYLRYPNRDNVLGPTRLFFSTYLESIWLLQICIAADFVARAGDSATASLVCEKIVEPSSAIISAFDEGMSNRQVWNNAALLAAAALRGDERAFGGIVTGSSGLRAHLQGALLSDATWYEGENYHLFALRGLWYGVTLAEMRGHTILEERDRFHRAFAAPFVTALPDFTMPSRKDSQYAVSLRQWRIAELTELGFARTRDAFLGGALARCYEPGHERRDTGRARSTADVERNAPGTALSRADLGWRALLHALPELPPLDPIAPRSVLLDAQGYAVFRREGDVYVGFEFGQSGGGHGHPDRLNLTLYQGGTRLLDDLGTGSYVDASLHWYRSTLAHNAPLVNGRSQPLQSGELVAYDEREGLGWIVGRFLVDDVVLERAVVVAPDYIVDELRWNAPDAVRVELPIHLDVIPLMRSAEPATLDGSTGREDGFTFVRDVGSYQLSQHRGRWMLALSNPDNPKLFAFLSGSFPAKVFAAFAPGQPASVMKRFSVVRAEGSEGRFRSAYSWNGALGERIALDDTGITLTVHGERHVHRRDDRGWHVELFAGGARSSVDLAGFRVRSPAREKAKEVVARSPTVLKRTSKVPKGWHSELPKKDAAGLLTFELGEHHYRRSELSWRDAGSPRASIALAADDSHIVIFARINAGDATFAPADASNPFDNESADTMRAGVELYARSHDESGAWMLVPETSTENVRIRPINDRGRWPSPKGRWRRLDSGYEMRVELPLSETEIDIDVLINETTLDRERRRGQLVLSGASGEFVYLRGDRHDVTRLVPLLIVP